MDQLKPGNIVPGKSLPVKVGVLGPTYNVPFIRCECGDDAMPIDSSYDGQRDTIEYLCPGCGAQTTERVH